MNPAKRFLHTVDRLPGSTPPGLTMKRVWAEALGLNDANVYEDEDAMSMVMSGLRSELTLIEALLKAQRIPSELYAGQLSRYRGVSSTVMLNHQWNQLVGNIAPPDTRLALAWAAAILPNDEPDVPEGNLYEMEEAIRTLETELAKAGDLHAAVRAYVQRQVDIIRLALRMYRVRGVQAVREGLENALGVAHASLHAAKSEAQSSPEAEGFVNRVNGVLNHIVSAFDSTDKIAKGGRVMIEAAKAISDLIN